MAAATGNLWCAYPDSECSSGLKYSNDDVGDDVGGTCTVTLTVTLGGDGTGSVTSTPAGIVCTNGTCVGSFSAGTHVALSQTPTQEFLGWSGDCRGFAPCTVTLDQDRAVSARFGTSGEGLWAVQIGGSDQDQANSVATTSDGDVIVVGSFTGTAQVGTTALTSHGGSDVFVAKLDGFTGSVLWARSFGGTGEETVGGVALDATDNIYIAAAFASAIDFGGGNVLNVAGGTDALIVKLTANGDYVWSKGIGGTGDDGFPVVAMRSNIVAVAVEYRNTITVDGTSFTSNGGTDIFLAALTSDGNFTWTKSIGGPGSDAAAGVAIASDGNFVIAGSFAMTADFGGGVLTAGGQDKGFVAKYEGADGAYLFAKQLGTSNNTELCLVRAVAVDAEGHTVTAGPFVGSIDFGDGSPVTSQGPSGDAFVAKYSPAGALEWVRTYVGSAAGPFPLPYSVTIDAVGNVAVTGSFWGNLTFGGAPLTSAGTADVFVARLSGVDGTHLSSFRAGGPEDDGGSGITQAGDGRLIVVGGFAGFADFAGHSLTSAGSSDAFVFALPPP